MRSLKNNIKKLLRRHLKNINKTLFFVRELCRVLARSRHFLMLVFSIRFDILSTTFNILHFRKKNMFSSSDCSYCWILRLSCVLGKLKRARFHRRHTLFNSNNTSTRSYGNLSHSTPIIIANVVVHNRRELCEFE